MPTGWRRSLVFIAWFGCSLSCVAVALVRGRGADRAFMSGLVGGPSLMVLVIGLAEISFPSAVIRARRWLLAGQGPGFGRDLATAFDSGLGISRGGMLLGLRALGLALCSVGGRDPDCVGCGTISMSVGSGPCTCEVCAGMSLEAPRERQCARPTGELGRAWPRRAGGHVIAVPRLFWHWRVGILSILRQERRVNEEHAVG